jgi:hypothetical protein
MSKTTHARVRLILAALALFGSATLAPAQTGGRPPSPAGSAAAQVGGKYVKGPNGNNVYEGGKWIELTYGRPLKRGRDLFGAGPTYGKTLLDGAPVWRAGANETTRLKTEVPLVIGGKPLPAGEYRVFIDLKSPTDWTLILARFDPNNQEELGGSAGYTPEKDVLRVPMTVAQGPVSIEQLTWQFVDLTDAGGALSIVWDKTTAKVPFTVGG